MSEAVQQTEGNRVPMEDLDFYLAQAEAALWPFQYESDNSKIVDIKTHEIRDEALHLLTHTAHQIRYLYRAVEPHAVSGRRCEKVVHRACAVLIGAASKLELIGDEGDPSIVPVMYLYDAVQELRAEIRSLLEEAGEEVAES